MDDARRIVALDEVPEDGSRLFTVTVADGDGGECVEAILLRSADGVVAYENYCQHWTDVRLDSGSGAALRDDEIVCEKHGAYFEADSGYCNFGPCEGATLEAVEVAVEDDVVYLADDRYAFEHLGPAADDDLSSGSRIGFSGS
ncbi:Ferredoxin subunit of nitrite reductase or a ring-hydroxylating dioxygenase [Halomicrobium zhouii]|uniref:Ferredoxin subunit of nitrite reductase or a ring-hydroxylating dioxygenase n=1 Tax=Halomicrobium zhouii TaxID=767519 RepID=A0A1I6LC07_9EURY|nr:Rieske 2Fe-2S domain-containing protein [Halomicrobium zhouii]SFS00967.1 Ferredoxin subunit of nitrite reductase or a ring-hydroxylating dioxygenase [Halomicrobium zhouii]